MRKLLAITFIAMLTSTTLVESTFSAPPPWQYGWWGQGSARPLGVARRVGSWRSLDAPRPSLGLPLALAKARNLGTALSMLGQRENGTERLLQAVEAYRDALKERTRERVPLQWETTQNNLDNAQTLLIGRLGEAVIHNLETLLAKSAAGARVHTREIKS